MDQADALVQQVEAQSDNGGRIMLAAAKRESELNDQIALRDNRLAATQEENLELSRTTAAEVACHYKFLLLSPAMGFLCRYLLSFLILQCCMHAVLFQAGLDYS